MSHRPVPASTRAFIYFGNWQAQVSWLLLNALLAAFWWVAPINDVLLGTLSAAGTLATVRGTITEVLATSVRENRVDVVDVRYTFRDGAGQEREGRSYGKERALRPGAPVDVEYLPADPRRSRARGLRRSIATLAMMSFALPFFGLLAVTTALGPRLKAASLLARGTLALGRIAGREEVRTGQGTLTAYKLFFRVEGVDDLVPVEVHDLARLGDVVDEREELLLYDPGDPKRAFALDLLPVDVEVDEEGNTEPVPAWKALPAALLPLMTPFLQAPILLAVVHGFP